MTHRVIACAATAAALLGGAATARAQAPFSFTNPNTHAPATVGDPISLSQTIAAGKVKLDVSGGVASNFTGLGVSKLDAALMGGGVDASHTDATGGPSGNDLGLGVASVDCPTSTQSTTSFLCIRGSSAVTPRQSYLINVNLDSYPGATPDPVALYAGVRIHNGGLQSWAFNTVTHLEAGARGGIGYELDLNNWDCDAGANGLPAAAGCTAQIPTGLLVTGASPFPAGTAISISGVSATNATWHDGISMLGGAIIDRYSIYTNNSSQIDYRLGGVHIIGLDLASGSFAQAAIRLGTGHAITWLGNGSGATNHTIVSNGTGLSFNGPNAAIMNLDDTIGTTLFGDLAVGGTARLGTLNVSGGIAVPASPGGPATVPGANCAAGAVNPATLVFSAGIAVHC